MTDTFVSTDQDTNGNNQQQDSNLQSQVQTDPTDPKQYSVGGKNFSDLDALKNSYTNQESHIKTIESENANMRQKLEELTTKLEKASTIDDVLERIQTDDKSTQDVNVEDIINKAVSTVKQDLTQEQELARQEANWKEVTESLTSKYGDKTDEVVKKIADENELTWDEAVLLARTKKVAFLNLFDIKEKGSPVSTSGSINTAAMTDRSGELDKKSVLELRTNKDRIEYFSDRLNDRYKELGIV